MKRFYINLSLVLLAGLLGILYLTKYNNTRKQVIVQKIIENKPKKESPDEYIAKLFKDKKSIVCEYKQDIPNASITGIIYFNNDEIRTDVTAPDKENKPKLSHTIIKDNKSYLWYENDIYGMVTSITSQESTASKQSMLDNPDISTTSKLLAAGAFGEFDLDCKPWDADNFMFTLPPKVQFVDPKDFYMIIADELCAKCDEEPTIQDKLACKKILECTSQKSE